MTHIHYPKKIWVPRDACGACARLADQYDWVVNICEVGGMFCQRVEGNVVRPADVHPREFAATPDIEDSEGRVVSEQLTKHCGVDHVGAE